MLTNTLSLNNSHILELDTFDWFTRVRHGHMGKWQYMEPLHPKDPVRGTNLWDLWERESDNNNMLQRQSKIISEQLDDMVAQTHQINTLVDLGPGGVHAVSKNTLPFIEGYGDDLAIFVAIDMAKDAAINARNLVINIQNNTECHAIHGDFLRPNINIPNKGTEVSRF